MHYVGEKIKIIRKKYKITQKQFADTLGISQTHVSKIEKNVENPSETLIRFIAYKYNVSVEWLKGENVSNDDMYNASFNSFRANIDNLLCHHYNEPEKFYCSLLMKALNDTLCGSDMYERDAHLSEMILKDISRLFEIIRNTYRYIDTKRENMETISDEYIEDAANKIYSVAKHALSLKREF